MQTSRSLTKPQNLHSFPPTRHNLSIAIHVGSRRFNKHMTIPVEFTILKTNISHLLVQKCYAALVLVEIQIIAVHLL